MFASVLYDIGELPVAIAGEFDHIVTYALYGFGIIGQGWIAGVQVVKP